MPEPNFVIVFPGRNLESGWIPSWSIYMQIARQMGMGPYWQSMRNGWHEQTDVGWLAFTVPDDFQPSTRNEPPL